MQRSHLIAFVAVVTVGVLAAQTADAQRRRRRRRPPPVEQTEPAEPEPPPDPYAEGGEQTAQATPDEAPLADATEPEPPVEELGDVEEEIGDESFGPDLEPLRAEFTSIMDELVQLRSTLAVLGRQLFRTKIRVTVQNRAASDNTLARIVVSLDGAPVFRDDGSGFSGDDGQRVFEGFAAPGPHVIGMEVEQRARADDNFRYTQRDTFRFEVLRGQMTEVTITLDDDSDIAEDFEDDGEGEYDVRTRVRVATRDLEAR